MVSNEASGVVNVTQVVDEQPVGRFLIGLIIVCFIANLWEGYDLLAAANAAPKLVADWHIHPAQLGPVFSASPFGLLVGALALGWLGDRIGRRYTVILGAFIFGASTLSCAGAQSIDQLVVLRFIGGIGLGGMLPNIIALIAEFAPRRVRATSIVVVNLGITAGSVLPGAVVAAFPDLGWRTIYVIGGIAPALMAIGMLFLLPESIMFLALRKNNKARERLVKLIQKMRPEITIQADTVIVLSDQKKRSGVAELFRGGLQFITPLFWLLFVAVLAATYFNYSWLPLIFRMNGFSARASALTTVFYYVGAISGSLLISRLMDRKGLLAVTVFFGLGCPAVAFIGVSGLPHLVISALIFVGGFCIYGVLLGLNAAAGLLYPARIRSTGAGWAFGIGRLGAIGSPMLGAFLIRSHVPISQIFIAPAVAMAIGTMACFILMRLCYTRFGGYQFEDEIELEGSGVTLVAPSEGRARI